MVKINVEVTSSKIFAYMIVILAFIYDLKANANGLVLSITIPIAAGIIMNKQYNDRKKVCDDKK